MNLDEATSLLKYCKAVFELIKNNSENEKYVFKKSFRAITELEQFLQED